MKGFQCTECDTVHSTAFRAGRCHRGIGGVVPVVSAHELGVGDIVRLDAGNGARARFRIDGVSPSTDEHGRLHFTTEQLDGKHKGRVETAAIHPELIVELD